MPVHQKPYGATHRRDTLVVIGVDIVDERLEVALIGYTTDGEVTVDNVILPNVATQV